MKRTHRLGVRHMDAKLLAGVLALAMILAGCGGDEPGWTSEVPAAPTMVSVTATQTPSDDASPLVDPTPTPGGGELVSDDAASVGQPGPSPTPAAVWTPLPWVCPVLHGRTEIATLDSQAMGEQVRYLIHVPPCYDDYPGRAFPTLYLFHGWPLDEWHWVNLGIADWVDDWVSRGITGPYIVVMPGVSSDGRYVNSSGGDSSFEGLVVNELLPAVDMAYRTLSTPEGRAVGGISRGAVWALEISLRHQDLFGAVGAHSPALALNNPLPQYDPYRIIQEGALSLRVYLDAGDRDWARAGTIKFRDALQTVGADVVYELREGAHVDELWRGGVPDYLAFYASAWPGSYDVLPPWTPPTSSPGDG